MAEVDEEQLRRTDLDLSDADHSVHDHGAVRVAEVGEEQLSRTDVDLPAVDHSV